MYFYLITVGEPYKDGVMSDDFDETLEFVSKLIEKLSDDDNFKGKYVYVTEYVLLEDGEYEKQDGLFSEKYLIGN